MRIVLRADASVQQGSGHVMRCLTLAEELTARGHEAELAVTVEGIPWLADAVAATGLTRVEAVAHEVDAAALLARRPDWVVVDSYQLESSEISAVAAAVPVLAIVDGETRDITAALYLEQNAGSENIAWPIPRGSRMLSGPEYALVRASVRESRRENPWQLTGPPRILAFMGGTDATGTIVPVARVIAGLGGPVEATLIAAEPHRADVESTLAGLPGARVLPPSPELAALMAEADIVVAASGTSAWEVGTLGLPAVLIAIVENQRASLAEAVRRGLVLGIDLVEDPSGGFAQLGIDLARLCDDEQLRRSLSQASTAVFDGRGAERVVTAMEAAAR